MSRQFAPILSVGAGILHEHIESSPQNAPEVSSLAFLFKQLAQDVDGYATSCLKQANTIKIILQRAREIMPPQQCSSLQALIPPEPATPDDYHVRNLGTYLCRLKIALIEVHAWLETTEGPVRDHLLGEIWEYLESQAKYDSRLMASMW